MSPTSEVKLHEILKCAFPSTRCLALLRAYLISVLAAAPLHTLAEHLYPGMLWEN